MVCTVRSIITGWEGAVAKEALKGFEGASIVEGYT